MTRPARSRAWSVRAFHVLLLISMIAMVAAVTILVLQAFTSLRISHVMTRWSYALVLLGVLLPMVGYFVLRVFPLSTQGPDDSKRND